jgi:hypothetical protein
VRTCNIPLLLWLTLGFWIQSALLFETANAGDLTYYYCKRVQGIPFSDYALTVGPSMVRFQPHQGLEAPGAQIFNGQKIKSYPSGNVLIDFETDARARYLMYFPKVLISYDLIKRASQGLIRIYNDPNRNNDSILSCEYRKIFI